jgi:hypothetical protein
MFGMPNSVIAEVALRRDAYVVDIMKLTRTQASQSWYWTLVHIIEEAETERI